MDYKKELETLDDTIFSQMRICSLNLKCDEFKIDFVPMDEDKLYKLYKNENSISSYFSIPNSTKNSLKIYLLMDTYNQKIGELKQDILLNFLAVMVVSLLLSFAFAIYTLYPLRNALNLTEEFIKDILHDFNTPLSTLRLNSSMLAEEIGENLKLKRIQNSVSNILNLQSNLRSYLDNHSSQKEKFHLRELLQERITMIEKNFKDLEFKVELEEIVLDTNKAAFTRILDNLLINAAKYNKKNGKVILKLENNMFKIEDTGIGIKNPSKVFERFYKEQERGIGIGLHIVKKLCEELGITIRVDSIVDKGTIFYLNIKNLT